MIFRSSSDAWQPATQRRKREQLYSMLPQRRITPPSILTGVLGTAADFAGVGNTRCGFCCGFLGDRGAFRRCKVRGAKQDRIFIFGQKLAFAYSTLHWFSREAAAEEIFCLYIRVRQENRHIHLSRTRQVPTSPLFFACSKTLSTALFFSVKHYIA